MAYKLTHPDSEHEIEVNASDLEPYLTAGWVTKPTANPPVIPTDKA